MKRFLGFTVEHALDGDRDALKEYTIGREVFDRGEDYDPRIDSIVRVEARRLRKKLNQYYEGEGASDRVRIRLPEGSYLPVWDPDEPAAIAQPGAIRLAVSRFSALPRTDETSFLAEGLTEDLITALSMVPGLRVAARPGADLDSGSGKSLEGMVRLHGRQLKVTARLVDVASGFAEWSHSDSCELSNTLIVQQEMASEISASLRSHLTGEVEEETPPPHIVPSKAYTYLIQGRHFASLLTPASLRRSIECYQQALRADPQYAAAYAHLAGSMILLSLFGSAAPSMVIQDANTFIYRALRLNPNNPAGHLWRGLIHAVHDWNWDGAEVDFQRALELNPNFVTARVFYAAAVMCPHRRFAEARAHLAAAALIDSTSALLEMVRGIIECYDGNLAEGEAAFRRTLELNPEFYGSMRLLAQILVERGRPDEAIAILESALPLAGDDPRIPAALGFTFARSGSADRARQMLASLDEQARSHYVPSYDRALIHLGLGELEPALQYLVQASTEHEPWLIMLDVDPLFDPLRGLPAFRALRTQVLGSEEQ